MSRDSQDSVVHSGSHEPIRHNTSAPPIDIAPGHIGLVMLPGSGRLVWWTGRVAIGLRHQPERRFEPISQSALWLQNLMLNTARKARAA